MLVGWDGRLGAVLVLLPKGDRTRLLASKAPLMYAWYCGKRIVTVGACEGEV